MPAPKPELYKAIPSGWSDDIFSIYDEAVETAPPGSSLVEIGSFWGKSAVYLAEAAKISHKGLKVYCVDTWSMTPENNPSLFDPERAPEHVEPLIHCQFHNSVFETFAHYIDKSRLSPRPLRVMRMASLEAAEMFDAIPDLSFVYLDGDHDYNYVLEELRAWEPLIRAGGMIAGHDYTAEFDGVRRATREYFKTRTVDVRGKSWVVKVN